MDNIKTLKKITDQKEKFYSEIGKIIIGQSDIIE